jgi:hypothetical protein
MSEHLACFESTDGVARVILPFDYNQAIADWAALRKTMVRQVPDGFTRDEWAYLVTFLDHENLTAPFVRSFGKPAPTASSPAGMVYRPRGGIAVWLPNNVSLLGPLVMVLLSLTGQPIRLKLGSTTDDLAGAFLEYVRQHLPEGDLKALLESGVTAERFERGDPRQSELARWARVRIVFGTDEAAEAIHGLPHPLDSVGISFVDRQSEAWLDNGALNDEVLGTLLKVFAIYGQAGCTSPRRVVLIDGSKSQATGLRDRLLELWPKVIRADTPMHTASENVMAAQWSRAVGWDTRVVPNNAAVLSVGSHTLPGFDARLGLRILHAGRQQARDGLPANIQTIGHALGDPADPEWPALLASTPVNRFVPLAQMHHFSSTWDGQDYWRQCFEVMEVR